MRFKYLTLKAAKIVKQKDLDITSSHGVTETITIYRTTTEKEDLQINRKNLLQLKM